MAGTGDRRGATDQPDSPGPRAPREHGAGLEHLAVAHLRGGRARTDPAGRRAALCSKWPRA